MQVHRQHFRGRTWHVVQDPGSNQFFRLNEPAYKFVALLDGRRNVGDAWHIAMERLGDDAPTQGEVIQLLGQLYVSNLLMAELPPDAETMFNRYKKRVKREVQGYLMNVLFVRLPLLDPDRFLTSWVGIFGRIFTLPGFLVWLVIIGAGLYSLAGREKELLSQSNRIFDPANLIWLYASLIVIKVLHEFGHAFACKRFGVVTGTGGEVHVMGVMLLVFTPMPYCDASSAWAFRSKWHRAIVNSAGMIVELAVAAVAAVVWAGTGSSAPTVHAIAYNMMFIASVSTVLFNGNPLLRYDAYYILSDLTEIPNLWNRSKEYVYYLVKRWVWKVKHPRNPAHTPGEKAWMCVYAVASFIYRAIIYVAILMFLFDRLPKELAVLALVFGVASAAVWVLVPTGKFLHYLATSGELMRVRARAVLTSAAAAVLVLVGVGLIRVPDRSRVEGVVEPVRLAVVYAGEDGFVESFAPSASWARVGGPPLMKASSVDLAQRRDLLSAERRRLEAQRRLAETREVAAAQALARQIEALDEQIQRVEEQIAALEVHSTIDGTWVSWDVDRLKGAFLRRGDKVGVVASLDEVLIRAVAGQSVAVREADNDVEVRVKGRPGQVFSGTVTKILDVGQDVLPSAALGYNAGGAMAVVEDKDKGVRSAERFFELRIAPDPDSEVPLMTGQRVVVRLSMHPKPIAVQAWRSLLQIVQKRFNIS